ncbi:hypothetical protein G6L29_08575 [Agrobacterium rhizogenes]|uniref:hypothetical protein n=1 Tax=Rhizobium rhizogenes TaxID=359 RepID=UPI00157484DF|nr:hypothetical protein [Rhizobium rhizogenes]NTI15685.1 hypothetical protein [Rhizobium rhizogenes]
MSKAPTDSQNVKFFTLGDQAPESQLGEEKKENDIIAVFPDGSVVRRKVKSSGQGKQIKKNVKKGDQE